MARIFGPFFTGLLGFLGLVVGLGLVGGMFWYQDTLSAQLKDTSRLLEQAGAGTQHLAVELEAGAGVISAARQSATILSEITTLADTALGHLGGSMSELSRSFNSIANDLRRLGRSLRGIGQANDLGSSATQLESAAGQLGQVAPELVAMAEQMQQLSTQIASVDERFERIEAQIQPLIEIVSGAEGHFDGISAAVADDNVPKVLAIVVYVAGGLIAFFGLAFLMLASTQARMSRLVRRIEARA